MPHQRRGACFPLDPAGGDNVTRILQPFPSVGSVSAGTVLCMEVVLHTCLEDGVALRRCQDD